MSKTVKYVLIISAAAIVLGLIIVCTGYYLFGGMKNSENFEANTEYYASDIAGIRVDVDTADVNIYPVSGDEITVLYYDNENHYFDISIQDDTLTIIRRQVRKTWFLNWFDWSTNDYELEIGIPSDFSGTLNLQATTGDLDIEKLAFSADVSIETTTGDIGIMDFSCSGDLYVSLTTGRIKLTTINVTGDLTLDGTTGDIRGSGILCGGSLTANRTTGDYDFDGVIAKDLRATATTGDIIIKEITVSDSIYIKSTTGSVNCSVTDGVENYSIDSDATTGSNNLMSHADYGEKKLDVYTTTGDINFDFNQ